MRLIDKSSLQQKHQPSRVHRYLPTRFAGIIIICCVCVLWFESRHKTPNSQLQVTGNFQRKRNNCDAFCFLICEGLCDIIQIQCYHRNNLQPLPATMPLLCRYYAYYALRSFLEMIVSSTTLMISFIFQQVY